MLMLQLSCILHLQFNPNIKFLVHITSCALKIDIHVFIDIHCEILSIILFFFYAMLVFNTKYMCLLKVIIGF